VLEGNVWQFPPSAESLQVSVEHVSVPSVVMHGQKIVWL